MEKFSNTKFFEILNQAGYSFVENPLPVFYVLFAYYNRIRLYVDEGRVKEMSDLPDFIDNEFYGELKKSAMPGILKNVTVFQHLIDYIEDIAQINYEEIVESLVKKLSKSNSKFSNCSFSEEFMKVIANLIWENNGDERYIVEAYGGCGSAQMMQVSNVPTAFDWIKSYNPDRKCWLIAKVRTYLHRLFDSQIVLEDPMAPENEFNCSLFLYNSPNTWSVETINDLIDKCLDQSSMDAALLHLPANFCYSPDYADARRALMESELHLSKVILLPDSVCDNLEDSSVLILLEKWTFNGFDETVFIDARSYVTENGEINGEELSNDIWSLKNPESKCKHPECFTSRKLSAEEQIFYPLAYFAQNPDMFSKEDFVNVQLQSIFSVSEGAKEYPNKSGVVITKDDFSDTQDKLIESSRPKEIEIPEGYLQHYGKSIVVSTSRYRFELAVIDSNIEFYTKPGDMVLALQGPLGVNSDIRYFAHALLDNPMLQANILTFDSFHLLKECLKCLKLRILYDTDDRNKFVGKIKFEHDRKFYKKSDVSKATSDLKHMLGLPFSAIADRIHYLKDAGLAEPVMSDVIRIEHNIHYINRVIDSFSNDFLGSNKAKQSINELMHSYIAEWEALGRAGFKLEFVTKLEDSVCSEVDKLQIYIMLDAILENARRHGFDKQDREGNLVQILLDHKEIDGTGYVSIKIRNNGHKLPEGFSLERYAAKGEFAGKNGHSGIGGFHVARVVDNHRGFLSITSDDSWGTVVEVDLPVKM